MFYRSLFCGILLILAGIAVGLNVFAQNGETHKSYNLKFRYAQNKLILKEITLEDNAAPDRRGQSASGWNCKILTAENIVLDSFWFQVPSLVCEEQPGTDEQARAVCGETNFSLVVPYYAKGVKINIYNPEGVQMLSIGTTGFAELCGDDVCESNENHKTCPDDCRSGVKDGVCDGVNDGTCDADCAKLPGFDNDCGPKPFLSDTNDNYLLVLMIITAASLTGFALWQGRKDL